MPNFKFCPRCEDGLPIDSFTLNKRNNDGRSTYCKACNKWYQFLGKYGITPDQYEEMLAGQGGKCVTCPARPEDFQKAFHVDHDHACCPGGKSCGKCIRGILCMSCNLILGHAKDDPRRLTSLAQYLQK